MNQWKIYLYSFDLEQPHPVVVISNDEICQNKDILYVNGLICTFVHDNRHPKKREIFLDEEDGLDGKTAVRCDFIQALPKSKFQEARGSVSVLRRKWIARKIAECFRFSFSGD